ncbi:hypothetical protein LXA43DRAFT_1186064 [Ganoderma leucocontextum]|nr:hypothetical protein LXA43DRAFT_1186064 [Ganoderma leucocontextum]
MVLRRLGRCSPPWPAPNLWNIVLSRPLEKRTGGPSAQITDCVPGTVTSLRAKHSRLLFRENNSTSKARLSTMRRRITNMCTSSVAGWTLSLSACGTPASAFFSVAVLVRMAASTSTQGSDLSDLIPLLPLFQATYPVDLPNTLGAYLICTFLACMLFGLTMHQSYRYFRLYPNDIPLLKVTVLIVLCLDLIHTVCSIHLVYFYLVSNYFHPQRLRGDGIWSIKLLFGEMGCMMFVTHSFFARRMFLLSRKLVPAILIVFLIFGELALCLAAAVEWFTHPKMITVETYTWLVWPTLCIAVIVDIVITTTLTYYLRKSRTGFKRTDSLVDVLMIYTINTGLSTRFDGQLWRHSLLLTFYLCSMLTTVALICAITMKNNTVYSAILIVATRMYANSMLAVLNSRNSILDKGLLGGPFGTLTFGMDVMHRSTRQAESGRGLQSIQFKHSESPLHASHGSEVNDVLDIQGKTAMLLSSKRNDSDLQTPQTGSIVHDQDE